MVGDEIFFSIFVIKFWRKNGRMEKWRKKNEGMVGDEKFSPIFVTKFGRKKWGNGEMGEKMREWWEMKNGGNGKKNEGMGEGWR